MIQKAIETNYPISFREELAEELGQHLKNRHSIELIGMKRIGISNFLRFFINHEKIDETYIRGKKPRLFIPIDLNDLIETEIFPFWRLTFKRIMDAVDETEISSDIKSKISNTFLSSIQTGDLLMTIDGIRESLIDISDQGYSPVIFLIRYDRLKNSVTTEFFNNLQSLISSTGKDLSFVFTSSRTLEELNPDLVSSGDHSAFTHPVFIKPASDEDMEIIFDTLDERYELELNDKQKREIIKHTGGHVQYLHLSFIVLSELENKKISPKKMIKLINEDERIRLQSEELYDHLTKTEKSTLMDIFEGKKIKKKAKSKSQYLWNSGLIDSENNIFSMYFKNYLEKIIVKHKKNNASTEFTKKEFMLFNLLRDNLNEICNREQIVRNVWPECKLYGVSDWSIDRLISRLRKKLAIRNSEYEIETIRTRGFKLVEIT